MHEKISEIKREFFALRNGMLADTLRGAGYPYRTIFGLNVPQLSGIARSIGADPELAAELWKDSGVRESRLLGAYLFDPERINASDAAALIEGSDAAAGILTREEADMLSFRLLKRLPFATDIVARYEASANPLQAYLATILKRHIS